MHRSAIMQIRYWMTPYSLDVIAIPYNPLLHDPNWSALFTVGRAFMNGRGISPYLFCPPLFSGGFSFGVFPQNNIARQAAPVLGRRSVAGGLSLIRLIYAWSMVDVWPLCGLGVRYGSTNYANSAFHPFRVGKWVVIHVITLTAGMETIKRQAGTVLVVVWLWG